MYRFSRHFTYVSLLHFRHYPKIVVIYRDPILRAMSPGNNLITDLPFNEQKLNDEYFENFAEDLRNMMPGWKAWFEQILKFDSKYCFLNYEKLKINLIKELRPVVNFLGFKINKELEKCIVENKEGDYHRPKKSKEDIDKLMSKISIEDLKIYSKMKEDVIEMLKNASSC